MIRLLYRKMIQDMKRSFVAYFICLMIVAIGFCGYALLLVCFETLMQSKDLFFENANYCDGYAIVEQAPLSVIKSLQTIPGVKAVEGRIVKEAAVKNVVSDEAHLKLLSVQLNSMNSVYLEQGRIPGDTLELVVGNGFFDGNDLQLGESLVLSINGANRALTICGKGLTPENTYMVKDLTEMLPAMDKYDAGFVSYDTMAAMYQMEGMANQFLFQMIPGSDFEQIQDEVETRLKDYGVSSVYKGDEDVSVAILQQELDQLDRMAIFIPLFFLFVAAIILYIMLHRLLEQQRTQIGTLLAMGMKPVMIRTHYMFYGAIVGIIGGALGGVLGNIAAAPLSQYYQLFFQLPDLSPGFYPMYVLQGMLMGGIFCAVVGWLCTGNVYRLFPATALRPEAPKNMKRFFLEKIPGFLSLFTVPGVIAIRSLARYKKRTALSIFGIACAFMVTATLVSMNSLFDVFLFDELEKNQQQDITVNFNTMIPQQDALSAIQNSAITRKEAVLTLGGTLYNLKRENDIDVTIMGIEEGAILSKIYDKKGNVIQTQREGIVISEFMAKTLGVQKGDFLTLKMSYPKEHLFQIPVTGIMAQYMGATAYMSKEAIGNLTPYREVVNSVLITAPDSILEQLKEDLKASPYVGTIVTRQEHFDQYRSMMGSMGAVMASLAFMGVLVGFSVIYTSSLIYYEELKREISTMMMLGLKNKECLDVIAVGQWVLTIFGVLLGLPMTVLASKFLARSFATDLFVIPDFVDVKSCLLSIGLIFLAVVFSSIMMLGKLKKIVPVELLRERE